MRERRALHRRRPFAPHGSEFTNIRSRCLACNSFKHTQCARLLEDDAKCTCQCYTEAGPAWWALAETARHWPESAAAYAVIARALCGLVNPTGRAWPGVWSVPALAFGAVTVRGGAHDEPHCGSRGE